MDNNLRPVCLNCEKTIEKGRSDKKFCDHYCRNAFNNRQSRDAEKTIKTINQILRKNRMILRKINPQGKSTVRHDYLELLDFNFKYFTHKYEAKNGNVYWFCYEYGYMISPDEPGKIVIVNWQNYMA